MAETQSQTGFDPQDREQILRALRRYMKEHGIGTPTLLYRIIQADPRRREVTLSTLQRFLAEKHHTQDQYVALCHAFVKDLPYYGEGQDIGQLGAVLSGFFSPPAEGTIALPLLRDELRDELKGRYQLLMGTEEAKKHPTLDIEVTAAANRPFMRVVETKQLPGDNAPRHRFEGVLVASERLIFGVLRNVLTHLPKIYWLERLEMAENLPDRYLLSQISETLFRQDAPDGGCVVNTNFIIEKVDAK